MKKVIIFGTGNWAELVAYQINHDSPYEVAGFTVDKSYLKEKNLNGMPVVPFEEVTERYPPDEYAMLLALSFQNMNKLRKEKYEQAKEKGYELINYISSSVKTWPDFNIGDSCLIYENCVMHPFVKMGNNVVVGPGAIIGHHSVIEDHVFIAPGVVILGAVTIKESSFIGANANLKEKVIIAPKTLVAMGVSITNNTQECGVYLGTTAKLGPKPSDEISAILTFKWP